MLSSSALSATTKVNISVFITFDRRSHEDNVVPEPLLVLTESNLLISHLVVDMVAKSLLQMSEHD